MISFERAEQYRLKRDVGSMPATRTGDPYGIFVVPLQKHQLRMIVGSAHGDETSTSDYVKISMWDHVSVSKLERKNGKVRQITPSWEDMCWVKDLFWDKEDCVLQFHPPASQYVNTHNHCLHLWRKLGPNAETPPMICV